MILPGTESQSPRPLANTLRNETKTVPIFIFSGKVKKKVNKLELNLSKKTYAAKRMSFIKRKKILALKYTLKLFFSKNDI